MNVIRRGRVVPGGIVRGTDGVIRYKVRPLDTTIAGHIVSCVVCTGVPPVDGMDVLSSPGSLVDVYCVFVDFNGGDGYILGFYTVGNSSTESPKVGPGDYAIKNARGAFFKIGKYATFEMFADAWANMSIRALSHELVMNFKNIIIRGFSGHLRWLYDKTGQLFELLISRKVNRAALSRGTETDVKPDELKLQIGVVDNGEGEMAVITVAQEHTSAGKPVVLYTLKIGARKDNSLITNTIEYDGMSYSFDLHRENGLAITVPKGDVTINTSDSAGRLYLGGRDNAQQLVTRKWLDLVFNKHTHYNGNQGSPTGLPIAGTPLASSDNKNNPYTYTTYAE